jgi:hypothetical protein
MGVAEVVPSWKEHRMDAEAPGLSYAVARLWRMAFPNVKVTPRAPGIRFERDVPVPLQDGTTLRANVFRTEDDGRFLLLLSAHPYGKDEFPQRTPLGYLPPAGYRFIRTLEPIFLLAKYALGGARPQLLGSAWLCRDQSRSTRIGTRDRPVRIRETASMASR